VATQPTEPRPLEIPDRDVRASRPYLLSRGTLRELVRRVLATLTLAALDVAGLTLGLYAALVLRSIAFGDPIFWSLLWDAGPADWLRFLIPITLLVFWQAGLYASRERRAGFGRVAYSLVLVAAITLAFGWGTGYDFTTSGLIPTACVTSALVIGGLRAAYESLALELQRVLRVRRRVLLVGGSEGTDGLRRLLSSSGRLVAYELAGVFAPGQDGSLEVRLREAQPDEIILNEGDLDEETVLDLVETAHRAGVRVRIAPTTTDLLVKRGEYVPGQGVPLFELRPPVLAGTDWAVKKAFDAGVSLLVLVAGLPLWLLLALAIKLDSRGPILYRDRRVGVGEREFGMLKFRTMVEGAAEQQLVLEEQNEAGGALFKIRDDPRVTRVGRFLRRFSLDEVPQVLNVLRGEMSLVGPRPLPLRDYRQLQPWHRKRYNVLPGVTGLWQISGRSNLTFDDLVRLDFFYIENWSIWLDISILVKTLPAVLARRGAY
jgi:exopolysaccharide biosynthesis polyprenyl glycosylphosphotransferase